ncbi:MAG: hypothetical protein Q8930_04275 [Bacillota bacterium]|nr:hypothetical protein [Bacillota bacterium]
MLKKQGNIYKDNSLEEIELERQRYMLRVPGVTELKLTPDIESISHLQLDKDQKSQRFN